MGVNDDRPPAGSPAAKREAKSVAGPETIEQIKHAAAKAKAQKEEQRRRRGDRYYRERRARERNFERMVLG